MIRRFLKSAASQGLHATGVDRLVGALDGGRAPLVLCYHRVVEDVRGHPHSAPSMLVSLPTLEAQLDWVARRFRIVPIGEIARYVESAEPLPEPLAAVTFDDGYQDVYEHALPLLRRKGFPAAVFVVTGLLDGDDLHRHDELFVLLQQAARALGPSRLAARLAPFGAADPVGRRWRRATTPSGLAEATAALLRSVDGRGLRDLLSDLRRDFVVPAAARRDLRTLDWSGVRALHSSGITIGSHTRSHSLLPNEPAYCVAEELAASKAALEANLGVDIVHLAFPDGQFSRAAVDAARDAGYRFAYTTCRHGLSESPSLTIPRRTFWERSGAGWIHPFSPAVASCQVAGIFDHLRACHVDHRPNRPQAARHRLPSRAVLS